MGNAQIRKLIKSEGKWTDKECPRHKHNFCIPVIVELIGEEQKHNGIKRYKAIKCECCNSFRDANFCKDEVDLPILRFRNPHFALGFHDIKFLEMVNQNEGIKGTETEE